MRSILIPARFAPFALVVCLSATACAASHDGAKPNGSFGTPPTRTTATASSRPGGLTVSSTNLTVGGPITVSGGNCAPGHIGSVALTQDPNGGPQVTYDFGEPLGQANAGSDREWTIHTVLPAVTIGAATLGAICEDPTIGTPDFTYSSVAVNVATPYHLQVDPSTTVPAGATLTVSSLGGGCDAISNPDVYLWSAAQPSALTGIGEVVGSAGGAAQWQVKLTVPPATSPGRYAVVARCAYSRSFRTTYEPVPVTVSGS